jgi:hypothetical protein
MSVFDVAKNNRGREDVGIYMSYKTFDDYLHKARQELIDQIKAIRDREYTKLAGDYEYYYGVDALLEELGENK